MSVITRALRFAFFPFFLKYLVTVWITYRNPHNTDQRLRVKVPEKCAPGDTFKVSVPIPPPEDNGSDENNFSSEFKDLIDDFARAYDDWCRAQVVIEPNFKVFKEKQAKFDKLSKEFPSNMLTKIDSDYLKKMVRRVRQYKIKKRKKEKALQLLQEEQSRAEEPVQSEEEQEAARMQRTINIPSAGSEFPTVTYLVDDFEYNIPPE